MLCQKFPERIKKVDARLSIGEVKEKVKQIILQTVDPR